MNISGNNNDPGTDLSSLITQVGTTWAVKSNPSDPFFWVFIDANNIIINCDCLDFTATRIPCNHMCMLKWHNKGIIVAPSNQQLRSSTQPQYPQQQLYQLLKLQPPATPITKKITIFIINTDANTATTIKVSDTTTLRASS